MKLFQIIFWRHCQEKAQLASRLIRFWFFKQRWSLVGSWLVVGWDVRKCNWGSLLLPFLKWNILIRPADTNSDFRRNVPGDSMSAFGMESKNPKNLRLQRVQVGTASTKKYVGGHSKDLRICVSHCRHSRLYGLNTDTFITGFHSPKLDREELPGNTKLQLHPP